jgi:hypothetical protein
MGRRGFLIGFLAGGWLATIVLLLVPRLGPTAARAEDPPPNSPPPIGPTVNPLGGEVTPRGGANPGSNTSDSNHRSIALSSSIGGGDSVVYYFDTEAERLCVYQYKGGSKGGLRLLAARYIGFDLRLESYRDLSERNPREMREAYEAAVGAPAPAIPGALPVKKVELPGGSR